MDNKSPFEGLFCSIPIIGMIHLAGGKGAVKQALDELEIFRKEGVDAAIIENYHGSVDNVISTLAKLQEIKPSMPIGINILPNEFELSFLLATIYDAKFIQLDHVAGKYIKGEIAAEKYIPFRQSHPSIRVLGGVWPKYYIPVTGSDLENDLREGMKRADAIVVTGAGTGKETPMDKIKKFRSVLGDYPLILGAGLTPDNAHDQLMICDGAIVGSSMKPKGNTSLPVDRYKVRDLMHAVYKIREERFRDSLLE